METKSIRNLLRFSCLLEHLSEDSQEVILGETVRSEDRPFIHRASIAPKPRTANYPYIQLVPAFGNTSLPEPPGAKSMKFHQTHGRWIHNCRNGQPEFIAFCHDQHWHLFCYDQNQLAMTRRIRQNLPPNIIRRDGMLFQLDKKLEILKIGFLVPND